MDGCAHGCVVEHVHGKLLRVYVCACIATPGGRDGEGVESW